MCKNKKQEMKVSQKGHTHGAEQNKTKVFAAKAPNVTGPSRTWKPPLLLLLLLLGPILCEIENADRKRKTAFFDLEFFDQKNKAILCARILAISEQHFSI